MICIIAEKHDVAKSIAEAIGEPKREKGYYVVGDYYITHCVGHLLEIAIQNEDERWSWNTLPIDVKGWQFKIKENTKEQYNTIRTLISKSSSIIHAGDPDDEGQLIVDEILYNEGVIDLKGDQNKPIQRLLINDSNSEFIKKEFNKLKDNKEFIGLTLKALSRSLADITFGYNLTRALTLKAQEQGNQGVISVGRVQTPMLALIVRRGNEIQNHVKNFYYDVMFDYKSLTYKYKVKDSEKNETGRMSEQTANSVTERVISNIHNAIISDKKTETIIENPPLPYNLLNLQVDCARQFKMKPDKVLQVTQTLREKHKAITYNRSDCQYLNEDSFFDAPKILKNLEDIFGYELKILIDKADTNIKSKCFNSSKTSAHTAIIPTYADEKIETLSQEEKQVYKLIASRYVLQFFPNAEYEKTTITIDINADEFIFISKKRVIGGWRNECDIDDEDTVKDEDVNISDLALTDDYVKKGDKVEIDIATVKSRKGETKPKKLYTTATFLNDLKRVADYCKDEKIKKILKDKDKNIAGEHGGIGTPATRSSIIKTLYDRGYIIDEKNNIVATSLGKELISSLPDNITYPDMTALWHEQLSDVEAKAKSSEDFINSVFEFSKNEINSIKSKNLNIESNAIKCKCGGNLSRRKGKDNFFWGCSNYPECKITYRDIKDKPDIWEAVACPECKTGLLHKLQGKDNNYWKCQNKECAKTFSDKNGKPNLEPKPIASDKYNCLECNSKLVKKKGQYGFFWSCTDYPTCKTNYNDKDGEPVYQKQTK